MSNSNNYTIAENQSTSSSSPPSTTNTTNNSKDQKKKNFCDGSFSRFKYMIVSECGFKIDKTENHVKRLRQMRKELNYLKETEWMYDSVEKRVGAGAQ